MSEPIRYVDALKAENERIRKLFEATERLMLLDGDYEAAKAGTYNRLNDELQCLKAAFTWRPIETAPKNGTWIMCYCENQGHIVLRFNSYDGWNNFDTYELRPTHWMPLPKPPTP